MKKSTLIRVKRLLSAWILFHLVVVSLLPNQLSLLNIKLRSLLLPYANTLGFNVTWRFFSPDPAPPIYVEYDLRMPDETHQAGFFPDLRNRFFFRNLHNRRVTMVRLSAMYPVVVTQMIAPWICRQHEGARSVSLSYMSVKPPTVEEVESGRPINDLEEGRERKLISTELCDRDGGST